MISAATSNKPSSNDNNIYLRNNLRWTENEDKRLIEMYYKYWNFKPISIDLKRSIDAVQARFVKIGICPRHDKDYLINRMDNVADLYNINRHDFARYLKYAGIKDTSTKTTSNKDKKYSKATQAEQVADLYDDDVIGDSDDEYEVTKVTKVTKKSGAHTASAAKQSDKKPEIKKEKYHITVDHIHSDTDVSDSESDADYTNTSDSDYDYESDHDNEVYAHLLRKSKEDRNNIRDILKYVKTLNHKITQLEKKLERKLK